MFKYFQCFRYKLPIYLVATISLFFISESSSSAVVHPITTSISVHGYTLRDPWFQTNYALFNSSMKSDQNFLRPLAIAYLNKTPPFVPIVLSNFFDNLTDVTTAINEVLQGHVIDAISDFTRVVINGIFGVFGLGDPAGSLGWKKHYQTFDLTLAHWGVKSGHYLFLPVIGPTTVRGTVGFFVDTAIFPLNYFLTLPQELFLGGIWGLVKRSKLLNFDSFLSDPLSDRYSLVRSTYWQNYLYHFLGSRRDEQTNLPSAEIDFLLEDPLAKN